MADPLPKVAVVQDTTRRPRVYTVVALSAAFALLVAVLGLNVAVNPRGDFPHESYRPLVEDVPREKLLLYRQASPVGAIIVGSSRAMPLPPGATGAPSPFNFGILGASLLDDQLVYDTVVREQGSPALLVVVLDTFQLIELTDRTWSEILSSRASADYLGDQPALERYGGPLRDALSADYVRDTLRVLRLTYVDGYPEPASAFLPDGQGVRPKVDAAVAAGTYDLRAAFERNWDNYLGHIYVEGVEPSPRQADKLATLVETARTDGVQVQVVLPPFHAWALERLEPDPVFQSFQRAALDAAMGLCADGVRVFDYTAVERFGGDPDGFYDGYHVTPANGAVLLAAMRSGLGDLCSGRPEN
jgi:hypothetical protein